MSRTHTPQKRVSALAAFGFNSGPPKALGAPQVTLGHSSAPLATFDNLPDSALLREAQLVQSPKRPHGLAPLPFSGPTLWRMVRDGRFPKPIKLSARVTAWRVGDVRAWLISQQAV